jgi:hypothetical protein
MGKEPWVCFSTAHVEAPALPTSCATLDRSFHPYGFPQREEKVLLFQMLTAHHHNGIIHRHMIRLPWHSAGGMPLSQLQPPAALTVGTWIQCRQQEHKVILCDILKEGTAELPGPLTCSGFRYGDEIHTCPNSLNKYGYPFISFSLLLGQKKKQCY